MQGKLDYLIKNNECEEAVIELANGSKPELWVRKYQRLYNAISISPTGLPPIADCNHEGIKYHFILRFHNDYQKNLV